MLFCFIYCKQNYFLRYHSFTVLSFVPAYRHHGLYIDSLDSTCGGQQSEQFLFDNAVCSLSVLGNLVEQF